MIQDDELEAGLLRFLSGQVTPHSGVPVYLQLQEAVTRAIQRGSLRTGDSLPTVRAVAAALRLAPNTVSRAYAELQRAGLIESRAGAGTSVSAGAAGVLTGAGHREALLGELRDLLQRLLTSGLSVVELHTELSRMAGDFAREAR